MLFKLGLARLRCQGVARLVASSLEYPTISAMAQVRLGRRPLKLRDHELGLKQAMETRRDLAEQLALGAVQRAHLAHATARTPAHLL